MRKAAYNLLFLLIIAGFYSAEYKASSDTGGLSAVLIKMRYDSFGMIGYGGKLIIRNTTSNELFESHTKIGYNPFIIVENLPQGDYVVEELEIIAGSNILIVSDSSKFNRIKINEPRIYYLGSYMTKKIPPLLELNFEVNKTDRVKERKIYRKLKKKSDDWLALEIDYEQSLFKADSTIISIPRNY